MIDAEISSSDDILVAQVLAHLARRHTVPRATYRIQFRAEFDFYGAADVVPYLADLGISHIYASPFLTTIPGSSHGYDVCSHSELNLEIGGATGFTQLVRELRQHRMGLLADIVPNHMSASSYNPWWRDVLENGPNSPFAQFFDIDWQPIKDELTNKVLLPILGRQYGVALENGELQIEHRDGGFEIRYFDKFLPMGPKTALPILTLGLEKLAAQLGADSPHYVELQSILTALEHLPPQTATSIEATIERQREKEVIKRRLNDLQSVCPAVHEFVNDRLREINGRPGDPHSFDLLDLVLSEQAYRLCYWRTASDEINYRRFFDINELAALCMENPLVFFRTHQFIMQLAACGLIDGFRVDHVDGLFAPEQYLWRLQWQYLVEVVRWRMLVQEQLGLGADSTGEKEFELAVETLARINADTTGSRASGPIANDPQNEPHRLARLVERLCTRLKLPIPVAEDWMAVLGVDLDTATALDGSALSTDFESTELSSSDSATAGDPPLFVLVEKILGPNEPLPERWPVAGTTGYAFLRSCNGVLIDPTGWEIIDKNYARLSPDTADYDCAAKAGKQLILRAAMASELQMLAHRLNCISEQHRASRDFTLNSLRLALRDVLVCFPVYRVYPRRGIVAERDQRFVRQAVAMAKQRNPATDPGVFDFIQQVLLLEHPPGLSQQAIDERELFAGRFQQVTSPVMAKGVEDTAFYVYAPLLSANEVGSDPSQPAVTVEAFHADAQVRQQHWPHAMLASSTHDTKRSEDVRARLNVLSEEPQKWQNAIRRWSKLNRRWRCTVEGLLAPDANDEYIFYQSLLGIWPLSTPEPHTHSDLVLRLQCYMEKATREAKRHTSWIRPNQQYDEALREFVANTLTTVEDNRFLSNFLDFQRVLAHWGLINSLSQLVLKLTAPGFPDIYQGQELWDFSLVDPDNRRPVDYRVLLHMLKSLVEQVRLQDALSDLAAELAQHVDDPRLKLFVTWRLLTLRAQLPALFDRGQYIPLRTLGPGADHLIAFARRLVEPTMSCLVVVPRLLRRLTTQIGAEDSAHTQPSDHALWQDTFVECKELAGSKLTSAFTDRALELEPLVPVVELFDTLPVWVGFSNDR